LLKAAVSDIVGLRKEVPSGVKMYSGVFAASPKDAADIVGEFLEGSARIVDFEVVDVDEEAIRRDRLNVRLHGFLKGPFTPMRLLGSKSVSPETEDEHESQVAVARFIVEEMKPDAEYILGPGTTESLYALLLVRCRRQCLWQHHSRGLGLYHVQYAWHTQWAIAR
jgi:predicted polyphosphate/ATP-dependent NAD kinase